MGNNRNVSGHDDENRASWRPQDDERTGRGGRGRGPGIDAGGQGQSGYGAGRHRDDHAFGDANRNQSYGGWSQPQGNTDDRWSGRGGSMADDDRAYQPGPDGRDGRRGHDPRGHAPRGYDPVMERDPRRGMHTGSHQDYTRDRNFTGGDRMGTPDRGFGPHDRSSWSSYDAPDEHPSYGSDQSMYGQGRSAHEQSPDRSRPGMHRGKGPKGYQRSDDRIRESVCETLEHDPHVDATHIEVVVKNGEVILTGTVEDRRTKRAAEDAIAHLPGVLDVQNSLRAQGERMQARPASGASGHTETEAPSVTSTPPKARA